MPRLDIRTRLNLDPSYISYTPRGGHPRHETNQMLGCLSQDIISFGPRVSGLTHPGFECRGLGLSQSLVACHSNSNLEFKKVVSRPTKRSELVFILPVSYAR
ncbi:hypothetical protein NLI96_g3107 [Meripilus lineatus]|uniref:Uncharacterized protein n=1 Tax=Meripilus lineatus TaxID=2056292 RepID=A0AAD5YFY4_9APHY|nr:hypothetical protein NLI96_g3107 [Physisporinus lineatus]